MPLSEKTIEKYSYCIECGRITPHTIQKRIQRGSRGTNTKSVECGVCHDTRTVYIENNG